MEPINELPATDVSQTPPPIQLNAEDKRTQQMNKFVQKGTSVLQTIVSGIGHVVQEIAGLILQR